jgi:hypothetical protein
MVASAPSLSHLMKFLVERGCLLHRRGGRADGMLPVRLCLWLRDRWPSLSRCGCAESLLRLMLWDVGCGLTMLLLIVPVSFRPLGERDTKDALRIVEALSRAFKAPLKHDLSSPGGPLGCQRPHYVRYHICVLSCQPAEPQRPMPQLIRHSYRAECRWDFHGLAPLPSAFCHLQQLPTTLLRTRHSSSGGLQQHTTALYTSS